MRATRPLAAGEEVLHSYGAPGSMAKVPWFVAAQCGHPPLRRANRWLRATLPAPAQEESALVARVPERGCGDALVPSPNSPPCRL